MRNRDTGTWNPENGRIDQREDLRDRNDQCSEPQKMQKKDRFGGGLKERYRIHVLPKIRLLDPEEDADAVLEAEWEELKKKTRLACLLALIIIAGTVFTAMKGPAVITQLARGDYRQGEKIYEIGYRTDRTPEDVERSEAEEETRTHSADDRRSDPERMSGTVTIHVPPVPISEEKFPDFCDEIEKEFTAKITEAAAKRKAGSRYLELPAKLSGAELTYESETLDVIDDYGRLLSEKPASAKLLVTIEIGEMSEEREICFDIPAPPYDPAAEIAEYLSHQEGDSVELPKELQAGFVTFYEKKKSSWLFGILFAVFLIAAFPMLAVNRYQKAEEERDQELAAAYPRFLSQFLAYLESGISINGCFTRVLASCRPDTYLAGELRLVLRRVRAGERPESVWEEFGRRTGRAEYRSFCTMIAQANRKGGDRLIRSLREELDSYYLREKNHVREKGQITGEKLLMPVGLMFLGLILALGIPALLSISF